MSLGFVSVGSTGTGERAKECGNVVFEEVLRGATGEINEPDGGEGFGDAKGEGTGERVRVRGARETWPSFDSG